MSTAVNLFKSSATRTVLTVISIVIGFFMLPFLVSKLGDQWYGIWTVIGSLTGYFYLVDFGLATAVTRYITRCLTQRDTNAANVVINTSLAIYSIMALLVIFLTVIISYFVNYFILNTQALFLIRLTILIVGFNFAIEFPFKAFAGIIGAYMRYDLLSYSHFAMLMINTLATIILLNKGYGILSLAIVAFLSSQLSNIVFFLISRYLFFGMIISCKYYKKEQVKALFGYSVWSFLIQVSDQVRFKIDSLVIAWAMSAIQVTHYFIGARLAEYFMTIILRATNILTPIFTKYHAENDYESIRSKLLFLTKINVVLATFGGGLIIIVGAPFIARWMGDQYLDAYPVLVVLIMANIIEAVYTPLGNVLYAIAEHRYLAVTNFVECICNLLLSITLVSYWGILGVAIGTAIPLVVSKLLVLPFLTCRLINLPLQAYYLNILTPAAFTIGFHIVLYVITKGILSVPQYSMIIATCFAAFPIYLLAIFFIAFNKSERSLLRMMIPLKLF